MSSRGSYTTAEPLEWHEANSFMQRLYDDGNYTISLFVACGIYTGLRCSDILRLKWQDLANDTFILFEKKTGKRRIIKINPVFRQHIEKCHAKLHPRRKDDLVFISKIGRPYTVNRLNVMFKGYKDRYHLNVTHFSTHALRKTFCLRVYRMAGDKCEDALVRLSELLGHSSTAVTRKYIGLTQQVMLNTYDLL